MKKIFISIFCISIIVAGCGIQKSDNQTSVSDQEQFTPEIDSEDNEKVYQNSIKEEAKIDQEDVNEIKSLSDDINSLNATLENIDDTTEL